MSSSIPVPFKEARAVTTHHAAGSTPVTTPVFKYASVVKHVGLSTYARRWKGCVVLFIMLALVGSIFNIRQSEKAVAQDVRMPLQYWTIQASDKVASAPVKSQPIGNTDTSLTAYFKRPLVELRSVKMAYGASMVHKGPNPKVPGEELFEVWVPPLNFPGLFKIQPIGICTVRATADSLQVEGQRVEVLGAGEDGLKDAKFNMLGEMQWIDTPSKKEISFKANVKLGLVPSSAAKAVMPQFLFERIGSKAMALSLDILVKGFARSFADDYERWAQAKSQS